MRNNYFIKLIKYINSVYHIKDNRINPTYKTAQIISLLLTGFLLRITSYNQLNCIIKEGEFDDIFSKKNRIQKIDAIRNSLKSRKLDGLRDINDNIIKKAVRNKF